MRRAIKRTGLPVAYTNGFSPQIKASFGPAISVGYESNCEYADLYLTEKTDISRIYEVFKEVLPEGYELSGVKYMPLRFPAIDRLVNVAEYIIKGVNLTQKQIDDFLNQDKILISKIKKDKQTVIDAKELIIEIKKIDDDTIKIMLRFFDGKNLKLDKILERLLNLRENEVKILYTKRNNLFIEGNGTIYEI
jgi:radical SAM-linked protein